MSPALKYKSIPEMRTLICPKRVQNRGVTLYIDTHIYIYIYIHTVVTSPRQIGLSTIYHILHINIKMNNYEQHSAYY